MSAAAPINRTVDLSGYELVDFGCSGSGGSIEAGRAYFNVSRALGLDIDRAKIAKLEARGFPALEVDLANPIAFKGRVGYSTMLHFLEHLKSVDEVRRAIHNAITATRKVVLVRYPWFDADGYLFENGLKFVWSDWRGHATSLNSLRMWRLLDSFEQKGLIARFQIAGRIPIEDSSHKFIVPLNAPIDTLEYDADEHGPKRRVRFPIRVFQEIEALLIIDQRIEPSDFKKLNRGRTVLYDSAE